MHTYTITHTPIYSYMHTYTHAYIHNHTYTYILIHTNVHTCIHTITRAHVSAIPMEDFACRVSTTDTYVCVSLYACLYVSVYGIMCLCVLRLTNNNHICMCSDTYKHTTKHTTISIYKRTNIQAYKHTHTHRCQ